MVAHLFWGGQYLFVLAFNIQCSVYAKTTQMHRSLGIYSLRTKGMETLNYFTFQT